ncbi:hypothetical protein BC937DRAFT_93413 [Endogone sp. FLAS-F59071]|nr:hypothetical protein BC937DRAFT_93413 [Endogone sp. FLAS-F59071]|eukprot:RUS21170.1 hypothetical protein BC937DRAFT_93413 [Endogone sp. FLAS-F59071]
MEVDPHYEIIDLLRHPSLQQRDVASLTEKAPPPKPPPPNSRPTANKIPPYGPYFEATKRSVFRDSQAKDYSKHDAAAESPTSPGHFSQAQNESTRPWLAQATPNTPRNFDDTGRDSREQEADNYQQHHHQHYPQQIPMQRMPEPAIFEDFEGFEDDQEIQDNDHGYPNPAVTEEWSTPTSTFQDDRPRSQTWQQTSFMNISSSQPSPHYPTQPSVRPTAPQNQVDIFRANKSTPLHFSHTKPLFSRDSYGNDLFEHSMPQSLQLRRSAAPVVQKLFDHNQSFDEVMESASMAWREGKDVLYVPKQQADGGKWLNSMDYLTTGRRSDSGLGSGVKKMGFSIGREIAQDVLWPADLTMAPRPTNEEVMEEVSKEQHRQALAADLNRGTAVNAERRPSQPQQMTHHVDVEWKHPPVPTEVRSLFPEDEAKLHRVLLKIEGISTQARVLELYKNRQEIAEKISSVSYQFFSRLVNVLSSPQVIDAVDTTTTLEILDALSIHLKELLPAAVRHLKTCIQSPAEFIPLLRLLWLFATRMPDRAQVIPIDILVYKFEDLGEMFNARENKIVKELLQEMRTIQLTKGKPSLGGITQPRPLDKTHVSADRSDASWIQTHRSTIHATAILPTPDELVQDETVALEHLHANLVSIPWPADHIEAYLDTHFALLRAEIIEPLRQHVAAVRGFGYRAPTPLVISMRAVSVTLGYKFEPVVRFGFELSKPVDCIDAYLRQGALVMLWKSECECDKMLLGTVCELLIDTVVEKNSKEIVQGVVGLHFSQDQITKLDFKTTYSCFQSLANFVALEPVLQWLKSTAAQCQSRTAIHPPIFTHLLTVCNPSEHYQQHTDYPTIPEYIYDRTLDISCVMKPAHKGTHIRFPYGWPNYLNDDRQPIFNLSASQADALRHVLANRVAVITGAPGTGKTFLATKIIHLLHHTLRQGQFHQPILVITDSAAGLDTILTALLPVIPDMVRFGPYTEDVVLWRRQVHVVMDAREDKAKNSYRSLVAELLEKQELLAYYWRVRIRVQSDVCFVNAMPTDHLRMLVNGYNCTLRDRHEISRTKLLKRSFMEWLGENGDPSDESYDKGDGNKPAGNAGELRAQWDEESLRLLDQDVAPDYVDERLLLCDDPANYEYRRKRITKNSRMEAGLMDLNIPKELIRHVWDPVPPSTMWTMSLAKRQQIRQNFKNVALQNIDQVINRMLRENYRLHKQLEELRRDRWLATCRLGRVVGMTAAFATANRELIYRLDPRVCVVDSSPMIESALMSCLVTPKMEHVVLIGDAHADSPHVETSALATNFGLDVSLLNRWICTGGTHVELKQQYRMSPLINSLVASFSGTSVESHLPQSKFPDVLGVNSSAFFLSTKQEETLHATSKVEARFVARFALYLWHQGYDPSEITILTLCPKQKDLVVAALSPELGSSKKNAVIVETTSAYRGRENIIVIVSMVNGSCSGKHDVLSEDQHIILPLSRAQHGLFIFGDGEAVRQLSKWDQLIDCFKARDLLWDRGIKINCQNMDHPRQHREIKNVADFDATPDGGCTEPCGTLLECGHLCPKLCHQRDHALIKCEKPCQRSRDDRCKHGCPKKCYECNQLEYCPPCETMVDVILPCGHPFTGRCNLMPHDLEDIRCHKFVHYRLPCGHTKETECFHVRDRQYLSKLVCGKQEERKLKCRHTVMTVCGKAPVCLENCIQSLPCGHPCTNKCGKDHTHERKDCIQPCTKQLICGHACARGCRSPNEHTDRCLEKCTWVCSHGHKCGRECWRACIQCVQKCKYQCPHYECSNRCYEKCDRPPCNKRCKRKLKCGHPCIGLCGENCPPCKTCNPTLQCPISLKTLKELDENEMAYELPECGCVFLVECLDQYFENQAKNGDHTAIKLWQCPTCRVPICTALRYNGYIKTELALVNEIKIQQEENRQRLTEQEKSQVISAMNEETKHGVAYNIVGGRWFVCPNNHPYYIGECGGATEVSKCPHCKASIGGSNHRVIESNRFYGEFDGSIKPAWPGQPSS